MVQRVFKVFRRKSGCGRQPINWHLVIMKTHENVENVRDLVKTDCHLAIRMTAEEVNMDQPNRQILIHNHERK